MLTLFNILIYWTQCTTLNDVWTLTKANRILSWHGAIDFGIILGYVWLKRIVTLVLCLVDMYETRLGAYYEPEKEAVGWDL